MSTYYQYQDIKVMIAHKLMNMEGWKVYGYSPDNSDSMTDYFDPAYWGGVAEKNGYILCVNVYGEAKPEEIRQYNYNNFTYDKNILEKITKLKRMTVERGASEAEEASAKATIKRLQKKAEQATENNNKYIVIGTIPGHLANPPRCNWHIEKDGIIIEKGTGILKYAKIEKYYNYPHYTNDMELFKKNKNEYIKNKTNQLKYDYSLEKVEEIIKKRVEDMEKDLKLINKFETFINKLDTICGGLLGSGDGYIYEKVIKTEYKKENKIVEDKSGSLKEGQLFIVKTSFNYGHNKGYVYRIHEVDCDGKKLYHAYKLNGKLTKECTGMSSSSNYWYITDNFTRWFEKGSLAWCHIEEVKIPYEVEKIVKKRISNNKSTTKTNVTENTNLDIKQLHFEILEDIDTRDNSKIYLAKVAEKLNHEDYIKVNNYIKSIGGYYSRFKHAFLFKENPVEKLYNVKITKTEQQIKEMENSTKYIITEDKNTKTGQKIWIVKPETELSKNSFETIKKNLAIIEGFYSNFKHGFIFKYDPTEKLKQV